MSFRFVSLSTAFAAGLLALAVGSAQAQDPAADMGRLRAEYAARERGIIMNNDGNDAVYECREETQEELLSKRTVAAAGTQIGSIFYCDWSSGFGMFTHRSEVAEIFDFTNGIFEHNITAALHEMGTDPLQIVIDWCKQNDVEVFWSMRMNDVHDGAMKGDELYYPELFPQFKRDHPNCLFGEPGERFSWVRHGRAWSAVDYGQAAVRQRAFDVIYDVARRYDIDGIELDFFRHMQYFKKLAHGQELTDRDRGRMTALIRRVRAMADALGEQRGRPMLLAVRVADSAEYSRRVGLDWEQWLDEGLIDILITSGYFRLNPWQYSADLGHKYGVQVYAGLSESRQQGDEGKRRQSVESYRARAVNAWAQGVDGIYTFNYANPRKSVYNECGSPETLVGLDKVYHVAVRGFRDANSYLPDGISYVTLPTLSPDHPVTLSAGETTQTVLRCHEDFAAAAQEGKTANLELKLQVDGLADAGQIGVKWNGEDLAAGVMKDGWVSYTPTVAQMSNGENDLAITLADGAANDVTVKDVRLWVRYEEA